VACLLSFVALLSRSLPSNDYWVPVVAGPCFLGLGIIAGGAGAVLAHGRGQWAERRLALFGMGLDTALVGALAVLASLYAPRLQLLIYAS
jgi:hypothetical protein